MTRRRLGLAVLAPALAALLIGIPGGVSAAPPPQDCDTPNQTGGTGIMLTPANNNTAGHQFLTKTYTGYDAGLGGYTYTVTSVRPSGTTFTEFTDCAYTTIGLSGGGTPQMPGYSVQQNNPSFVFHATCPTGTGSCWTINFTEGVNNQSNGQPDDVCDRVQIKGTDGSTGGAFIDYSNLVSATGNTGQSLPGSAISCSPSVNTPEVPATVLVLAVGAGAIGAFIFLRRRNLRRIDAG